MNGIRAAVVSSGGGAASEWQLLSVKVQAALKECANTEQPFSDVPLPPQIAKQMLHDIWAQSLWSVSHKSLYMSHQTTIIFDEQPFSFLFFFFLFSLVCVTVRKRTRYNWRILLSMSGGVKACISPTPNALGWWFNLILLNCLNNNWC